MWTEYILRLLNLTVITSSSSLWLIVWFWLLAFFIFSEFIAHYYDKIEDYYHSCFISFILFLKHPSSCVQSSRTWLLWWPPAHHALTSQLLPVFTHFSLFSHRSPFCKDIVSCRGDHVRLAVRVRVFTYPENTCAVWLMFACKYCSVLWSTRAHLKLHNRKCGTPSGERLASGEHV